MARLHFDPLTPSARTKLADPMVDLDRLLDRLQNTILKADADRTRRLKSSEHERQKLRFNIDYARTLLTRTEQDAFSIKILSRRQETQADLNQKREILDQIMQRMRDFDSMSPLADDDDTDSEGDEILNEIIQTPSESTDSRYTEVATQATDDMDSLEGFSSRAALPNTTSAGPDNERIVETLDEVISEKSDVLVSQNIRPRGKHSSVSDPEKQPNDIDTALTTGAATSLLFGNRTKQTTDISTSEAILDHQRKEQEEVTEELLRMASQLKLSSQKFGTALQEDTEVLTHAGQGLSKNEISLEAAARKMGAITKMTEGKGWWGRIMLYAWIYGIMVILVLIVFALPKLRF